MTISHGGLLFGATLYITTSYTCHRVPCNESILAILLCTYTKLNQRISNVD